MIPAHEIFEMFLDENGALYAFTMNFFTEGGDLSEFYEDFPSEDYLSAAFDWNTSPEGYDYWENINNLWRIYEYEG